MDKEKKDNAFKYITLLASLSALVLGSVSYCSVQTLKESNRVLEQKIDQQDNRFSQLTRKIDKLQESLPDKRFFKFLAGEDESVLIFYDKLLKQCFSDYDALLEKSEIL